MSKVKLEDLLAAGCHFGHLTSRWNPKMKSYIFMEKNGIHVLDLKKTAEKLTEACDEIEKIAAKGGNLLYVGTKKQAQDLIESEATRSNNFFVKERWLGGTLTNFATVRKSVRKLKGLEKKAVDGTYEKITKKEILDIDRQKEKMSKVLGGIAAMKRIPSAMFVIDTNKEQIAIMEAKKLKVPVFAIVDTNSDPTLVDFPIPANDDASKSISIITKMITEAFISGASKVKAKKSDEDAEAPKKAEKVKEDISEDA
ncbi:MAG: 30S ribosomal protein S2 [Calditrichaeota bacterium]|nr:30S ribosomal protein S2 [Calditrichota bacterium]